MPVESNGGVCKLSWDVLLIVNQFMQAERPALKPAHSEAHSYQFDLVEPVDVSTNTHA